jgi:MFS family permease
MPISDSKLEERSAGNRAYVLFILVVVYTFNFIDRQIVGILAVPIKADLGLTDTQLGLMGGLAFALFYTGLGIPVAMLADRFSRTWIMTVALTVWSAMTAASGLATNFGQLFLARLVVGVGEAGGVAPAYSLISDYFPPGQRARALSIFSFGIPIGSAIGIVFGGIIASLINWRYAFFIVGLAGIIIAPIFRLTIKEPPRGQYDRQRSDTQLPFKPAQCFLVLRCDTSDWRTRRNLGGRLAG